MSRELTEKEHEDFVARFEEALVFSRDDHYEKSLPLLEQLLADYPNHPAILTLLSEAESELGMSAEALAHGRLAAQIRPRVERASVNLFYILIDAKRYREAYEELVRYIAIRESSAYDDAIKALLTDPKIPHDESFAYLLGRLKELNCIPYDVESEKLSE